MALQKPLDSGTATEQPLVAQTIAAANGATAEKAPQAATEPQVSAAAEQAAKSLVADSVQNDNTAPASQPSASEPEPQVPNEIGVVCADTQGILKLDFSKMRCVILYRGQEMSGTEFEKAAGREKAKKWKTSVRVSTEDGKQGEMVGDWLQRHGLDVRMSQLFKLGEARPAPVRAAPAPRPPPPNSTATLATSVSDMHILDHLDKQYIGLQQGDPDVTFDKLPKGNSRPALEPGVRFVDLSKASYEELMELAAASAANPFSEMLSFNPGVLPSRLGYMTGQQPKRQKVVTSAPDLPRAQQLMTQYLEGSLAAPPWDAMGVSKAPVIGGRELDLRKLYDAVQQSGGYEAAVANKKFGRIAAKLAIDISAATNAAYLLKIHYQRLLAPFLEMQASGKTGAPAMLQALEARNTGSDAEPSSSNHDDQHVTAAEAAVQRASEAGPQDTIMEDSTMQQHQAVLNARLQNEPESSFVAQEDEPVALPDVISTFKSTLVDSSGPIPGL